MVVFKQLLTFLKVRCSIANSIFSPTTVDKTTFELLTIIILVSVMVI